MQLLKESLFPAFEDIQACLILANMMLENIIIQKDILNDEKYKYLFSVEEVNRRFWKEFPFADAYKNIANEIKDGRYKPNTEVNHTHEGSIGNLCNDMITLKMQKVIADTGFEKAELALKKLVLIVE